MIKHIKTNSVLIDTNPPYSRQYATNSINSITTAIQTREISSENKIDIERDAKEWKKKPQQLTRSQIRLLKLRTNEVFATAKRENKKSRLVNGCKDTRPWHLAPQLFFDGISLIPMHVYVANLTCDLDIFLYNFFSRDKSI